MSDVESATLRRSITIAETNGIRKPWASKITMEEPSLSVQRQVELLLGIDDESRVSAHLADLAINPLVAYLTTEEHIVEATEVRIYRMISLITQRALAHQKIINVRDGLLFLLRKRQEKQAKKHHIQGNLRSALYYLSEFINDDSDPEEVAANLRYFFSNPELCLELISYLFSSENLGSETNPLPFQIRGVGCAQAVGIHSQSKEIKQKAIATLAENLPIIKYSEVFQKNHTLRNFMVLGVSQIVTIAELSNDLEVIEFAIKQLHSAHQSIISSQEQVGDDGERLAMLKTSRTEIAVAEERLKQLKF